MPAILTHEFFGRDAFADVAAQLGMNTPEERDAFLLGNQGPDPLFYLIADPRVAESNHVGNLMHHVRPAKLLSSLHDALSMLSNAERNVGRAYAAGFLCHYLLDSSVHPLVFSTEYMLCDAGVNGLDRSDGTPVHAEIERDIDEMVLYRKLHRTVRSFKPYSEVLRASDQTLAVIDKLYFYMNLWTFSRTLDLDCYTRAVRAFRRVQRLFYAPAKGKTLVLSPLERALAHRRYSLYAAMSHRNRASEHSDFANEEHAAWENPFTGEPSTESFWDLYEEALSRVFDAERAFFSPGFGELSAERLTGNLNFSGQPTDPVSLEEPPAPEPRACVPTQDPAMAQAMPPAGA